MDIEIIIEKNKKDFKVLKNNSVILKGSKPKRFTSETNFFFNNSSFKIKKKSFWSSTINIFKGSGLRGEFVYNWKTGYSIIIYENNKEINKYVLASEKPKGWYKSDTIYTLKDKDDKNVLSIYFKYIKWKENITAELIEDVCENYEFLIYAMYLMRLTQQQSDGSGAAAIVMAG